VTSPRAVQVALATSILVASTILARGAGAMGMPMGCSSGQIVKTRSYVFALDITPVQQMYTQAQVKTEHPKTGEVMFSGTMTGMNMSTAGERHLEVHICTQGGTVVTGAHPRIVVDDPSAKTMMMTVPIVTMEGIGEGAADYHYGNNVDLTSGAHITVTAMLNGQQAVFHTTVAKTTMSMSG
jgi:hypothetical protein